MSAACGVGEEPYTLAILWRLSREREFPDRRLLILATDINREQLDRALVACYTGGSLRKLPTAWIGAAFEESDGRFCLRTEFQAGVEFRQQDIRAQLPNETFDLVFCRNLVFTYFEEQLQREVAASLHARLVPSGVLVLGIHEVLPPGTAGFHSLEPRLHIYRRDDPNSAVATNERSRRRRFRVVEGDWRSRGAHSSGLHA